MTKFARFNIIWQRDAFLTSVVLVAEYCTFISDNFALREASRFVVFQNISQINAFFVFP